MDTLAKWMIALLVAVQFVSCSTPKPRSPWGDYTEALNKVRAAKSSEGMPREKVFYHFRLYGVPSTRWMGGVRGGYASQSEHWDMHDGYTLSAYKHWRANFKIVPLKKGSPDAELLPTFEDEKYYHEPRLEPYFDTLILTDRNKKIVGRIDLPYYR